MALHLGELEIHAQLSIGDVCASEIFYHKIHLLQFHNRYKDSVANKGKTEENREVHSPKNN